MRPHGISALLLLCIIAGASRFEGLQATAPTHAAMSTLERALVTARTRHEPVVLEPFEELRMQPQGLKGLPPAQRWWMFRQRLQLKVYTAWQKSRGRDFEVPRCDTDASATYRPTKQIPGIFIPFFGRRIWLLVPVTLEHERVDSHSEDAT